MREGSEINIAVIGGDCRQRLVADELIRCGYRVSEYAVDGDIPQTDPSRAVEGADVAVLPLPASRDGFYVNAQKKISFDALVDCLSRNCKIFAGRLQPALKDMLSGRGFEVFDFYEDELFERENTEISADGAIEYLLSLLGGQIAGKSVLVCGYGHFGASICHKLNALSASVTVAARRDESLYSARQNGNSALKIDLTKKVFFSVPEDVCAVLNTVPYHIFTEENTDSLRGKIYLELASAPFGGDTARLKEASSYSYLPSIPAKYAPDRAGKAMLASLLRYIDSKF